MPDKTPIQHDDGPPEKFDVSNLHAPIAREKLEPRDGFEPVPIWLVSLFGVVVFWAGFYFAKYNGGFSANAYDGSPMGTNLPVQATDVKIDPVVLGKKLFTGNCVSCHQADGQGQAGQYPPLAGSEFVNDERHRPHIKRILLLGLQGTVTVKGNTYNGNMPAFGKKLKDEQIAAVLTYVRQEWGNKAPPILPEEIAEVRKTLGTKTDPWTFDELLKIGPDPAPATASAPTSAPEKKN